MGNKRPVKYIFKVNGVEVELNYTLIKDVNLNANYTFTEKKDDVILRVPKHKANASLAYNFSENTLASVNYQYVGRRLDLANVNLEAFSLIDLYFSQKIIKNKVKLFTSVTNVFNEDYFEILGYTTKGRNVNLGLHINL